MAKKEFQPTMPRYGDFYAPLVAALKQLGGSAMIDELNARVLENMNLPKAVLEELHEPEKSS